MRSTAKPISPTCSDGSTNPISPSSESTIAARPAEGSPGLYRHLCLDALLTQQQPVPPVATPPRQAPGHAARCESLSIAPARRRSRHQSEPCFACRARPWRRFRINLPTDRRHQRISIRPLANPSETLVRASSKRRGVTSILWSKLSSGAPTARAAEWFRLTAGGSWIRNFSSALHLVVSGSPRWRSRQSNGSHRSSRLTAGGNGMIAAPG